MIDGLTVKARELLKIFQLNKGKMISRAGLYELVWPKLSVWSPDGIQSRTLDQYVMKLRRHGHSITTCHKEGYIYHG